MSDCRFSLSALSAVSPRYFSPETWRAWAQDADAGLPECPADVSFLPPMQRRRLNAAARLIFAAVHRLGRLPENCPSVFVSHDGEICRSFDMLAELMSGGAVSPTAFGLSVHNAAAGQFSLWQGNTAESTSLAAAHAGWEYALVEACALLNEGAPQVLVVAAEQPLDVQIAVQAQRAPFAYALAAVVAAGTDFSLRRLPEAADTAENLYWGALPWLRRFYRNDTAWTQHYPRESWQWTRNL